MHPLATANRSRLLETEPKLFVFETSYYDSVDDVALNLSLRNMNKVNLIDTGARSIGF